MGVILICDVCGYAEMHSAGSPKVREQQGAFELSICPSCSDDLEIPPAEMDIEVVMRWPPEPWALAFDGMPIQPRLKGE